MDLLPGNARQRQQQQSSVLSDLSLGNTGRRTRTFREYLPRSISTIELGQDPDSTEQRNSVAWQTMCQNLNLQLEEYQHASELATHHRRVSSLVDHHQQQLVTVTGDEEISSVVNKEISSSHRASDADLMLEFERGTIEDKSLLTTDIHITPIARLVERFDSNLQQGLTNDTVAQHHIQFGQNKLTPPPKPSLLWMFLKQSLIGFNGILWVATLFAFLSYVSK